MATLDQVQDVAEGVLDLLDEYPHCAYGEGEIDRVMYGYIVGRFGQAAHRQWKVFAAKGRAGRVDFRLGGNNPVVFELAVHTSKGGMLSVGANKSELKKLSRVPQAQAKVRALLLLNFVEADYDFDRLKRDYQNYYLGPGKFTREPVSVIYVSPNVHRRFIWSPYY